jgi:hypothetical protein
MEELLTKLYGHKVDILCVNSSGLRGEVGRIENHVLHLKDKDDRDCYVAIEKIVAVWEQLEDDHRAGFMSTIANLK